MRPVNERDNAARRRGGAAAAAEWAPLLEILRSADSPVGAAVHWVETQQQQQQQRGWHGAHAGGRAGGGKRRKASEMWRFVPELLASDVVYVEEEQNTEETRRARGLVGNCIWMQTFPTTMQTNMLTFLNVEHIHFHGKDLELLARCILSSPLETGIWLTRAATLLLDTALGDLGTRSLSPIEKSTMDGIGEFDAVPDWLNQHTEQLSAPFSLLRQRKFAGSLGAERGQASDPRNEQQVISLQGKETPSLEDDLHEAVSQNVSASSLEENACRMEGGTVKIVTKDLDKEKGSAKKEHFRDEAVGGITSTDNGTGVTGNLENFLSKEDLAAKADLGEELFSRAVSLRNALKNFEAYGLPEEINIIRCTPKLSSFLSVVRAWELDDEVTVLLVGSLLKEEDGYVWSTQLLKSIFLPKLLDLVKPASRILITALVEASKLHPRATVEAVVFPLICSDTGASTVQCEVINRMTKDCLPIDVNLSVCQKMFSCWEPRNHCSTSRVCWVWTEGMITVVQNLLNLKLDLDQGTIAGLVCALDGAVSEYSTSLKFGSLLLNFFTKYASKLELHKEMLHMVANRSKTFLTKSLLTKLALM